MSQDDPRQVAFRADAPPDERFDANAELGRIHRPLASQLIPPSDLQPVFDLITDGLEAEAMMKAEVIRFPGRQRSVPAHGMRSVWLDDLQIFAHGEYFEKASPLGFEGLRSLVEQTPILASVVMTRVRQLARFTQPSEDGGPGFEIRHVERQHKLTPEERESTQLLSQFFRNCGWEFNPRQRKKMKRDNFSQFISKSIRDTLSMDASPIETEMKRNKALGIDGFYAVDGATVRLCTDEGYDGDDQIFALQVVQGRLATAYNYDQLIYEVRNPRADVRLGGYGLGEPELMIRVVTGFLNALTYNIKGFDENAIPKGMLHLSGNYSNEDLSAFKRYWNAMVKGINNSWSLPVMVSSDQESKASFERFGIEFNEMYFAKWMTFLGSIICAIYGMDPAEINFESFSANKSSLSGNDTEERLASSQDKGLRPLMAFYEATLSDFIVSGFDAKYCFRFVGLDENDQKWRQEASKLVMSVDELRAEQGLEKWGVVNPGPVEIGSAPINPSLLGAWQQGQQQGQQQGDFGTPPVGDGGEGPAQGQDGAPPADASGEQPPAAGDGAPGDQQQGDQQQGGGEFGGAASADDGGEFGKALAGAEIFSIEG